MPVNNNNNRQCQSMGDEYYSADGGGYATSGEDEEDYEHDSTHENLSEEEIDLPVTPEKAARKKKGKRRTDGQSSTSGRSGGSTSGRKRSQVGDGGGSSAKRTSNLVSAKKRKPALRGGVISGRRRTDGQLLSDMSSDGGSRVDLAARLKALEDLNMKQLEVIEKQKKEVSELRDQVKYNRNGKGKGKNRTRRKETLTPLDEQNRAQVNNYIRKDLFPRYKILPRSWPTYSEDARSFCQHIMKRVKVPGGGDEEIYWEGTIRDLVNEKYGALKANFKASMWRQFVG